jgi:hypothetical protein
LPGLVSRISFRISRCERLSTPRGWGTSRI